MVLGLNNVLKCLKSISNWKWELMFIFLKIIEKIGKKLAYLPLKKLISVGKVIQVAWQKSAGWGLLFYPLERIHVSVVPRFASMGCLVWKCFWWGHLTSVYIEVFIPYLLCIEQSCGCALSLHTFLYSTLSIQAGKLVVRCGVCRTASERVLSDTTSHSLLSEIPAIH